MARGIVHTAEYREKMRAEQEAFDRAHNPPCHVCGRRPADHRFTRGDQRMEDGLAACEDCWRLVALVEGSR